MLKTNIGFKTAASLVASVVMGASASAAVVYDNSSSYLGFRTDQGNAEIGDTVQFEGSDRIVTQIDFEYFVNPGASGNEMGVLSVYANDAAGNFPGTLLYQSNPFSLATPDPEGFGSVTAAGFTPFTATDLVTWTVSFSGIEEGEDVGLLFYNPPTVGSSVNFDTGTATIGTGASDFFVQRNGASWEILSTPSRADNFGARFTAVPEPTTWALLIGGLATFGLIRRRK